jgi:GWxTD domain-containing protein
MRSQWLWRSFSLLVLSGSLFLGLSAAQEGSSAEAKSDSAKSQPSTEKSDSPGSKSQAAADSKGQDSASDAADTGSDKAEAKPAQDKGDPLKRPISEKQRKKNEKSLKVELSKTYKKWLDEDVRWIITDEEKEAFKKLSNDEERDQFIEQFWARRNPTPDSVENPYKEEHYRRIAYANEHFAAGIPGWRTDRGRIYIMYGAPDEIEAHPTGGTYDRPQDEGGGTTSTYPFEDWRYRYLEGVGQEVIIEFVDTCMCGDFHMTMDRSEKDALLYTPGAGLTQYEQMGLTNKANRFSNPEKLGLGPFSGGNNSKEFDRLEQFAKLNRPPDIKFKDLEEVVTHKLSYNLMPFDVQTDFVKVTSETVLVPVTVQIKNRDISFSNKDGVQKGTVNIFGRATTLTGRVSQTFEDTVQVEEPTELLPQVIDNNNIYWKALPLRPGRYRLDLVVKDVNGDRVGTWSRGIVVPEFSEDKLSNSSLILADQMEKVPARDVGTGNFVIGTTKVRPRLGSANGKPPVFKRSQKVNFWMQVYNLSVDQQSHKPSATVEYNLVNTSTNKQVIHTIESTSQMGNVGDQVTLEKSVSASTLQPGTYRLSIKVNDNITKQTVDPSVTFAVE